MNRLCVVLVMLISCIIGGCKSPVNEYSVIPYPSELVSKQGAFHLSESTQLRFIGGGNCQFVAQSFADFIAPATGFKLSVSPAVALEREEGAITFIEDSAFNGEEGSYQLTITETEILVKSNNAVGLFYGFQTMRQLLPSIIESREVVEVDKWLIPAVEINDVPRFSYRGLHLDVGRHFYPVDFIKKFIDLLALHKMNVFHWHLTEDQGWRLEIKKYPELIKTAAYRNETKVGHASGGKDIYDGKRYGGYYTQEQAREIVKYAADRFITVIPEIELPGHAQAALAAYPHLGCTGGPYDVAKTWGVFKDVYCAGNEQAFRFLEDVLLEVMDIFPSKYIHIGGDECPKDRWNECPKCKARMRTEGCKDAYALQSYFVNRVEKFLNGHGRDIIGWDEILEGGLAPNATVMSWRGIEGGIEAARQKHKVIMTPNTYCYLDHYQNDSDEEPLAIGGFLPLSKVYSYNPIPPDLTESEAKFIIGVQGNLWTEYMPSGDHVEYMAYPRACALAEVGWLQKSQRNFDDFARRLNTHCKRLDILGVNYFNKVLMPTASSQKVEFITSDTLDLINNAIGGKIYYTLDGSTPNQSSNLYENGILISEEGVVKAVAINQTGEVSEVLEVPAVKLEFMQGLSATNEREELTCKFVEGQFTTCSEVDRAQGRVFDVTQIGLPEEAPEDHFGVVFQGYINIEQTGLYKFKLGSDDGAQFFLNNQLIIDNDGCHAPEYKKSNLALKGGKYPFKLIYFESTGGQELGIEVILPSGDKVRGLKGLVLHRTIKI
ncbi:MULTISPECIES: family 20 glycosylhydrolase [unclassified Carboxylicivirga]|uniref:family 20 glycosylhydrolase n=1 Tax=Carboxylicivirga TaxID=1628153 RepID=UPI003D33BA9C